MSDFVTRIQEEAARRQARLDKERAARTQSIFDYHVYSYLEIGQLLIHKGILYKVIDKDYEDEMGKGIIGEKVDMNAPFS